TCQRLKQHKPKGIGAARKYKDVSRGINSGQRIVALRSEKYRVRIFFCQGNAFGSITNNNLCAWQLEIEECFEVLFDRDPPHCQKNRAGQTELCFCALIK